MALAIFDLDNTLIAGDSDHAWGDYLIRLGAVDAGEYKQTNDQFYQDYLAGDLDILSYLEFALKPLTQHSLEQLQQWRRDFVEEVVEPLILEKGKQLIQEHRDKGDYCLIITATNRFVTEPIAALLDVDDMIATEPEILDGRYTGNVEGTPSYQEGKITRLQGWLEDKHFSIPEAYFYSDSHNDIPLLELVGKPVAVDADPVLAEHARQRGWQIISLR